MIYIITVNFFQDTYLEKIISLIENHTDIHLVIVDNSNTFNKNEYSGSTTYVPTSKNLGYLNGLTLGLENIEFSISDTIVFSNPDIVYNDSFFKKLKKLSFKNQNDLIAPSIIDSNNYNQNPNRIKKYSKFEIYLSDFEFFSYFNFLLIRFFKNSLRFLKRRKKLATLNKECEIFLPHGSCMIFKGSFFNQKPFFDYDIFLWGEEAVIAKKVNEKGGRVIYMPSLYVNHQQHSTTKNISSFKKYKLWKKSYRVYRDLLF